MHRPSGPSRCVIRSLRFAALVAVVLPLLIACGRPTPTPVVLVVTSTFTPEPQVIVVTATFTPAPEVAPTQTETPPPESPAQPTEAPRAELEFVAYEHSSGAFSLEMPASSEYQEEEEGVAFAHGESLLMVIFTSVDTAPDPDSMEAAVMAVLDESLVGEGMISSYDNLDVDVSEEGDAAVATFGMVSDDFGDGQGALAMRQVEQTLYMLILLTPDYAQVEEVWQRVLDTLTFTPVEPTAPPVQPTATAKPRPTATRQPAPTPAPTSSQGCYLIENHIGAELTFTFTARDRQWSDTFTVPANGTKEYCLDPGRYTYTIDAPPPWGSTNGELEVRAGERLRFPVGGG